MASKFTCLACPTQTFSNRKELSRHYSVFHRDGKIPCPQCPVELSRMTALKAHLKIHDSNRNRAFKCTLHQCGQRFYTAKEAKVHFARLHSTDRPFPCPLKCGKRFKIKGEVNRHVLSHTHEKPYKCEECDGSFQYKSNLQNHIQSRHTVGDEGSQGCTQCGKTFKTTTALQRHILRIHTTRGKDFPCPLCAKKFTSKSYLTLHSVTHNPQRKFMGCYFCCTKLTTLASLEAHLRLHTTEKPFFCPETSCNYSSAKASVLSRHGRNAHHNPLGTRRKHTCYFCLATFIASAGIVKHMRSHTLEEPFSCELCRKSFKSKDRLSHHIRSIHTKEKPHKCSQCEKCFGSGSHLKRHAATHANFTTTPNQTVNE